jgi:hypothetical protein
MSNGRSSHPFCRNLSGILGAPDSCLMSADACFMAFSLSTRPSARVHDSQGFGNGYTLYGSFGRWRRDGVWKHLMDILHPWELYCQGHLPELSAGCAERRSIKTAAQGQDIGFDGNK